MKKPTISYFDFQKLDIRAGEIKEASRLADSRNLLQLKVDLGEDYGIVEILSGIANEYKPENIVGKKFPFLANLEPKKMLGKYSNGMIFAVDVKGKAILFPLRKKIPSGSVVR